MVSLSLSARSLSTPLSLLSFLSPGLFQRVLVHRLPRCWQQTGLGSMTRCPHKQDSSASSVELKREQGRAGFSRVPARASRLPWGRASGSHTAPLCSKHLGPCLPDPAFLLPNLSQNLYLPAQKGHRLWLLLPFHLTKSGHPSVSVAPADLAARWALQCFHHHLTSAGMLW